MEDSETSAEELFQNESKFYQDAEVYWSKVEPTVNGMLGGFGSISNTDIQGSETFLKKIFNGKCKPDRRRALDCGAGIGRITKNLLVKYFDKVDLVEQNSKFVEASKHFLLFEKNIGNFYNAGLQNFAPLQRCYDVIWCQWVLGHLTDQHLLNFLIASSKGLKENGVIVIKENISTSETIVDEEDSSVTRTEDAYLQFFKKANLQLIRHCKQQNFPKQLFVVKMFALKPNTSTASIYEGDNINSNDNSYKGTDVKPESPDIINKFNIVTIKEKK